MDVAKARQAELHGRPGVHVTQRGLGSSVAGGGRTHCGVAQCHDPQDTLRFREFQVELGGRTGRSMGESTN